MRWYTGFVLLVQVLHGAAFPSGDVLDVRASNSCPNRTQHLSAPPYDDYFYSDCHSAAQVVVTTPQPDSNLSLIGPRLIVAWPAGNSGVAAFFAPQNGKNGTLSIALTSDQPLIPVYNTSSGSGNPVVGIKTHVRFNSSAALTVPILGSIRTIRDFTEGPSILVPIVQDAIKFSTVAGGGAMLSRLWLDNITTTQISFVPSSGGSVKINNKTLELTAGTYEFTATFDYPQLTQLKPAQVLNSQSSGLIKQQPGKTTSLSFLSYTEKLLAGAWRFLTYFGRDSMIALLLMQPVLSEGEGGAIEAVIGAVLERVNRTTGVVCHEETIGDYATYENSLLNISSTKPSCSYVMVDTNNYLAPVIQNYFLKTKVGQGRRKAFFAQKTILNFGNEGLTYAELALANAEKVMRSAQAFAQPGGQKIHNLVHLEPDQIVGQWRDSTYGIGGGRIPFDVNTALVPAALNAIAALSEAGFFPSKPQWKTQAAEYAKVFENSTLPFFEVTVPEAEAKSLVTSYTSYTKQGFPSHVSNITAPIVYHGLSLNGYDNQSIVKVMNSDSSFRHFLLNASSDTAFINSTANNIIQPFPVGLSTDVGMLIANPAYGGNNSIYAANWTRNAYQGTVVWSFPMAMMAAGFQRQLERCSGPSAPEFCAVPSVKKNVLAAYNHLWDSIDANTQYLSNEVWSWQFKNGKFDFIQLGALPPPPGLSPTESDIRQLWSLTYLAVTRDKSLK